MEHIHILGETLIHSKSSVKDNASFICAGSGTALLKKSQGRTEMKGALDTPALGKAREEIGQHI